MKHTSYVVKLGPEERDEYTARKPVELDDGSLQWMDTAGIPHIAPPGTWWKEEYEISEGV